MWIKSSSRHTHGQPLHEGIINIYFLSTFKAIYIHFNDTTYLEIRKLLFTEDSKGLEIELNLVKGIGIPEST